VSHKQKKRYVNIWARGCICGEPMYISNVDWANGIVTLRCHYDSNRESRVLINREHGGEEGTHWRGSVASKKLTRTIARTAEP
jgi:hypothetical protein